MKNIYFELTEEFNALGPVAALGSGQAVVFYRLALASKDGDWIVREDDASCEQILSVLAAHGACYRLSAPLDVRWLRGGWSSHFEFLLVDRLRVRCDFFSRPPRVTLTEVDALFATAESTLLVLGVEPLVRLKRTQRAKDYPIIGELARLLPPEIEVELTTDPDRVLELAADAGARSLRPCVVAARDGDPERVELELVREMRRQRQQDRERVERYTRVAGPYLSALMAQGIDKLPLRAGHIRAVELAEELLPTDPLACGGDHADVE